MVVDCLLGAERGACVSGLVFTASPGEEVWEEGVDEAGGADLGVSGWVGESVFSCSGVAHIILISGIGPVVPILGLRSVSGIGGASAAVVSAF